MQQIRETIRLFAKPNCLKGQALPLRFAQCQGKLATIV